MWFAFRVEWCMTTEESIYSATIATILGKPLSLVEFHLRGGTASGSTDAAAASGSKAAGWSSDPMGIRFVAAAWISFRSCPSSASVRPLVSLCPRQSPCRDTWLLKCRITLQQLPQYMANNLTLLNVTNAAALSCSAGISSAMVNRTDDRENARRDDKYRCRRYGRLCSLERLLRGLSGETTKLTSNILAALRACKLSQRDKQQYGWFAHNNDYSEYCPRYMKQQSLCIFAL